MAAITAEQWQHFDDNGYVVLEPEQILDTKALAVLTDRIDGIMLGEADVDYGKLMMQLDSSTGDYKDAGEQTLGHKGKTLAYRKIQQLESDPIFFEYMKRDVFREACARVYGADTPIASFRAMFMNKPATKGTFLPWHQDRWQHLDKDPLLTVYTALDAATPENGCVQIIPGSHKLGLLNPEHPSGFLEEEHVAKHCSDEKIVDLRLLAGQVALLHNWTVHRSGINSSTSPRRAFSVNYMDATTGLEKSVYEKELQTGHFAAGADQFPRVFG
eukprot:m.163489 g.163489  ORF g.163489 m.163489 type:complete len:272 (+) comp17691_c0_seq3:46-861(+)